MSEGRPRFVLVHADESCLGNQNEGDNPGGAAALVEARGRDGRVVRRDLYIASPGTTNNRMALGGAITLLEHLRARGKPLAIHYYSDSRYLVQGMRSWIRGWKARGWRRKTGAIENLALWQRLDAVSSTMSVTFHWVRGHAGHPKNEYADRLAVRAAAEQVASNGLVPSGLETWLDGHPKYGAFSPDAHFEQMETRHHVSR